MHARQPHGERTHGTQATTRAPWTPPPPVRRRDASAERLKSATVRDALDQTFRVLGDPTRASQVWALSRDELYVCDLAAFLGFAAGRLTLAADAPRPAAGALPQGGPDRVRLPDDAHVTELLALGVQHVEEALDRPDRAARSTARGRPHDVASAEARLASETARVRAEVRTAYLRAVGAEARLAVLDAAVAGYLARTYCCP